VTKESGDPERGEQLMAMLLARCELLARRPLAGRNRSNLRVGMRSFPAPPFVIFYRPGRTHVTIVRFVHERRRLEEVFPPRKKR
jgi:plasmid stabilization system protein ParE